MRVKIEVIDGRVGKLSLGGRNGNVIGGNIIEAEFPPHHNNTIVVEDFAPKEKIAEELKSVMMIFGVPEVSAHFKDGRKVGIRIESDKIEITKPNGERVSVRI